MNYQAPPWLPGGHLQTIWPALYGRPTPQGPVRYRRERWTTPDADFIDVDHLDAPKEPGAPLLVLFHGLEGSSGSHYALAFAALARQLRWGYAVPHFRGCGGEINLAPRAYHSGDHEEVHWILQRFQAEHSGPLLAVGVSLGGNALMRWAGESGTQATRTVSALACVCAPLDLVASGRAIGRGFNRVAYTPMFLKSMKPRALAKLQQYPGLFDRQRLLEVKNLYDFDNLFTAPLHGFRDTDDYWTRASAKPVLHRIGVPALVLNPLNDPFVPASSLPRQPDISPSVQLWQPKEGGHVGFATGPWPGELTALPQQVMAWLSSAAGATHG